MIGAPYLSIVSVLDGSHFHFFFYQSGCGLLALDVPGLRASSEPCPAPCPVPLEVANVGGGGARQPMAFPFFFGTVFIPGSWMVLAFWLGRVPRRAKVGKSGTLKWQSKNGFFFCITSWFLLGGIECCIQSLSSIIKLFGNIQNVGSLHFEGNFCFFLSGGRIILLLCFILFAWEEFPQVSLSRSLYICDFPKELNMQYAFLFSFLPFLHILQVPCFGVFLQFRFLPGPICPQVCSNSSKGPSGALNRYPMDTYEQVVGLGGRRLAPSAATSAPRASSAWSTPSQGSDWLGSPVRCVVTLPRPLVQVKSQCLGYLNPPP